LDARAPSQPTPDVIEQLLIARILGAHGLQRIQTFRQYQPGWDFGEGQPMSESAYRYMSQFLRHVILPPNKRPSVFLGATGNLELAWEDESNKRFQAEFSPTAVEYSREDTGAEGELDASEIIRAAEILSV
jgi:hypothetical protein